MDLFPVMRTEPELSDLDVEGTGNTYVPEKRGMTIVTVIRVPPAQPCHQVLEPDAEGEELPTSPMSENH